MSTDISLREYLLVPSRLAVAAVVAVLLAACCCLPASTADGAVLLAPVAAAVAAAAASIRLLVLRNNTSMHILKRSKHPAPLLNQSTTVALRPGCYVLRTQVSSY